MVNVRQFLEGARFPANRQELVKFAEDHHAPQDIIESLLNMRDKKYNDLPDVTREISL